MPCFSSHYCHGPCVWNFLINVKVYNILLALAYERIDKEPTGTESECKCECVYGCVYGEEMQKKKEKEMKTVSISTASKGKPKA